MPVGVARQNLFASADVIVAGAGAGRVAAILYSHNGRAQHAPRLADRLVGRPQMLLRAIDDRAHGFLQGAVLLVDAVDAGIALGALHLAVEAVIVGAVLLRAEGLLVDKIGAIADAALGAV